jgi:hypothetical protein
LSDTPVRVIQIEEDDKGLLSVIAEELVNGVSTPAINPSAGSGSAVPNWTVPAPAVNAPLIFEPPPAATSGASQLWVGASGSGGAAALSKWGGANVYVSIDNTTYSQVATLTAPLRQGVLTSSLPTAFGWDTTNQLTVDLSESGATLSGTSQAAAQQGATLTLVDSELLAYESATLTAASAYTLSGLARGIGGTEASAHAARAPFARLDAAIVKYDLPANLIGQTLYFKFQSFNVFGGGLQDLSSCAVYPFTPTGAGTGSPVADQLQSGIPLDLGAVATAAAVLDDFGNVSGAALQSINLGSAP